jgi:V-type H+-transporting ATPase subunit F
MDTIEPGYYVAVIGDEDTVTGFLLTWIDQMDQDGASSFLVVREKTTKEEIERGFTTFTDRDAIAFLLINQHIANEIRGLLGKIDKPLPAILEIPSKEHGPWIAVNLTAFLVLRIQG